MYCFSLRAKVTPSDVTHVVVHKEDRQFRTTDTSASLRAGIKIRVRLRRVGVTRRQPSGRETVGNQETPRKAKERRNAEHFAGRLALDTFLLNSLKADRPRNDETALSLLRSSVVSVNETARRTEMEEPNIAVQARKRTTAIRTSPKEAYVLPAF